MGADAALKAVPFETKSTRDLDGNPVELFELARRPIGST
jgi:hypothetical protein